MKKIIEYLVVTGNSANDLNREINKYIEIGWDH